MAQGTSGDFYLTLNFDASIASGVSFSNFVVRYQGIDLSAGRRLALAPAPAAAASSVWTAYRRLRQ